MLQLRRPVPAGRRPPVIGRRIREVPTLRALALQAAPLLGTGRRGLRRSLFWGFWRRRILHRLKRAFSLIVRLPSTSYRMLNQIGHRVPQHPGLRRTLEEMSTLHRSDDEVEWYEYMPHIGTYLHWGRYEPETYFPTLRKTDATENLLDQIEKFISRFGQVRGVAVPSVQLPWAGYRMARNVRETGRRRVM